MSKKFLILGNPVKHSLSPKIHNFWFKKYNIDAIYEKKEAKEIELPDIIKEIKEGKIDGANVTVPFKQKIIPHLDDLNERSKNTKSVNTIYKNGNKIIGDNTDIYGFTQSLKNHSLNLLNKIALIIGAGGVAPSIITALENIGVKKIFIKNRTYKKIENLKKEFPRIELLEWDKHINFDIVINATSLGLKEEDEINLNFDDLNGQKIFYDTIYNPPMTNFLKKAKEKEHTIINGKLMLFLQAQKAFEIWTKILPELNEEFLEHLKND